MYHWRRIIYIYEKFKKNLIRLHVYLDYCNKKNPHIYIYGTTNLSTVLWTNLKQHVFYNQLRQTTQVAEFDNKQSRYALGKYLKVNWMGKINIFIKHIILTFVDMNTICCRKILFLLSRSYKNVSLFWNANIMFFNKHLVFVHRLCFSKLKRFLF